jgi:hypothetical protein
MQSQRGEGAGDKHAPITSYETQRVKRGRIAPARLN